MKEENKQAEEVIDAYNDDTAKQRFDVLGSYTGNSEDNEKPVQDGDDI